MTHMRSRILPGSSLIRTTPEAEVSGGYVCDTLSTRSWLIALDTLSLQSMTAHLAIIIGFHLFEGPHPLRVSGMVGGFRQPDKDMETRQGYQTCLTYHPAARCSNAGRPACTAWIALAVIRRIFANPPQIYVPTRRLQRRASRRHPRPIFTFPFFNLRAAWIFSNI